MEGFQSMSRLIMILIIITIILIACEPVTTPILTEVPQHEVTSSPTPSPTFTPFHASSSTTTPAISTPEQLETGAHIWYLGSNGWAVRINEKLLIFDYQEHSDPNPPASGEIRNLQRGYIDPSELQDLDIYVFVTHSHQDHFDRMIYEWQEQVAKITYLFGWQAGNNPEHHYLVGPRATINVGDMEVYTINSHHAGVPEVAFLVIVDGYTIYHNGDYKAAYQEDYEYLRTFTDHIDIAFVIGHPFVDHQYFQQALLLTEIFHPTYMFGMNREGEEYKCIQFAELLVEHVGDLNVLSGNQRGDHFICPRTSLE